MGRGGSTAPGRVCGGRCAEQGLGGGGDVARGGEGGDDPHAGAFGAGGHDFRDHRAAAGGPGVRALGDREQRRPAVRLAGGIGARDQALAGDGVEELGQRLLA